MQFCAVRPRNSRECEKVVLQRDDVAASGFAYPLTLFQLVITISLKTIEMIDTVLPLRDWV